MFGYEYLQDVDFLAEIDQFDIKTTYVKIVGLDINDRPLASLEGVVTGGTVNLNGQSSVRRTATLSLAASTNDYSVTDIRSIISVEKRVKIEIGIENMSLNNNYTQPILWFPLGIYIIKSANISYAVQNYSISISLSDKMCLLNGEIGGIIINNTTFSPVSVEGSEAEEPVLLYTLIQSILTQYAGIPEDKIIIHDIDNYTKSTAVYKGDKVLEITPYTYETGTFYNATEIDSKPDSPNSSSYYYTKNESVGYRLLPLTFPRGQILACQAGETITSVLDKIKNILGNYEYFFDVEGIFHFQKIPNFLYDGSEAFDFGEALNDKYLSNINNEIKSKYAFTKNNLNMLVALTNNTDYAHLKNHIVVLGNLNDNTKQFYRYEVAIDSPPTGNLYDKKNERNYTEEELLENEVYYICNNTQKHLIIQNLFETEKNRDKEIEIRLTLKNSIPSGYAIVSGYYNYDTTEFTTFDNSKYFYGTKISAIFPVLENLSCAFRLVKTQEDMEDRDTTIYISNITVTPLFSDWRDYLYYQLSQTKEVTYYSKALLEYWPQVYDIEHKKYKDDTEVFYYFDMIDPRTLYDQKIASLSVNSIGLRTKVIHDERIASLRPANLLDFCYIEKGKDTTKEYRKECENRGFTYCQVDSALYNNLTDVNNTNTAYDLVRAALHQVIDYNESISISAMPIFCLEPNTRIKVENDEAQIHGDYIIQSISMPLAAHSGTMSISAVKAIEMI